MQNIRRGVLIIMLISLFGCNASITRRGYSINELQTSSPPCPDIIIKKNASIADDVASVVGRIEAKDSGFSTACSEAYVLGIFRKDACALGAHIINITEETQPNFWSTCYRAKADLLKCKDKSVLALIKSDPQYASELILQRSKKTAVMSAAAMGAVGGGAIGGAIAAVVMTGAVRGTKSSDQNASDWHVPAAADLGDGSPWRKENTELYLTAKADFDGDGDNDTASLLINEKENKVGLFVTLTSHKNSPPMLLESLDDKQTIKDIGIRVASPDNYKTACGKGYRACNNDEPSAIQINYPAIDLFQYEGANSFFIWDGKENTFRRIWISD